MCDPVSAGAAILTTAGTVANNYETANRGRKAGKAAAAQARQEMGRQEGFSNQSYANLGDVLQGYMDPSERLNAAAATRAASLGDMVASLGTPGYNVRADAPDIVKRGFAREQAASDAAVAERTHSLSRTGGLGDMLRGDTEAALSLRSRNDVIGDSARRSMQVNQYEQQGAFNTANRRPVITLGDLLQLGGAAASLYGLTSAGAAAKPLSSSQQAFTSDLSRYGGPW